MKTKPEKLCKLNLHSNKLAKILAGLDSMPAVYPASWKRDDETFGDAAGWLQLAADMKAVTLDPFFDSAGLMCRPAAEYDDAKANLHADFALRITRFTFAWNAFEILVGVLKLDLHPSQKSQKYPSKAKRATWFLKKNAVDSKEYRGYLHVLEHGFQCASKHAAFRGEQVPHPKDLNFINEAGYGLDICRVLRNSNVHGLTGVPITSDWAGPEKTDIHFYSFALRLLLLSMQMLLVCQIGPTVDLTEDDILFDLTVEDEDCGTDFIKYLKVLHLTRA
jgi:hypothetical protein